MSTKIYNAYVLDKYDKGVANIYAMDKFREMKDFDKIKKKALKNVIVELKDDMLVKVATTAMFRSLGETPYTPVKAEIYDDICFMGRSFLLDVLNGCRFIDDIDEKSKIRVETSFERFESFRRRVGKLLTKSSICELSKLSPKRILGLMWE